MTQVGLDLGLILIVLNRTKPAPDLRDLCPDSVERRLRQRFCAQPRLKLFMLRIEVVVARSVKPPNPIPIIPPAPP